MRWLVTLLAACFCNEQEITLGMDTHANRPVTGAGYVRSYEERTIWRFMSNTSSEPKPESRLRVRPLIGGNADSGTNTASLANKQ